MVDNLGGWLVVNVLVDNLRRSLVVDDDWLRSVVNNGRWNDVHNLWLILLDDMRLMVVRGINDDNVLAVAVAVAVTVAVTVAVIVAIVATIATVAVSISVSVVGIDDNNLGLVVMMMMSLLA